MPGLGGEVIVSWGDSRTSLGAGFDEFVPLAWIDTYPKLFNVGFKVAQFLVKSNQNGQVYFVVVSHNDPAPLSEQIKAAKDASGHKVKFSGNASLIANTELTLVVDDLSWKFYDIYFVAEDLFGNLQEQPVKITFIVSKDEPVDPDKPGVTTDGVVLASPSEETMVVTQPKITSSFTSVTFPPMKGRQF